MSSQDPRENEAIDSLITASLHITDSEVSIEDVQNFLKTGAELSPEELVEFQQWHPNLRDTAAHEECETPEEKHSSVFGPLYVAMNRKNAEDVHSEQTDEELARQREAARKRLQDKHRDSDQP